MVVSIILLLMIALASAAISFTISTTSIFLWLRELVSPWHHKVEELIHCPWCLSHYISALGLALCYNKVLFLPINMWLHLILDWFALLCVVGLCHYVLLRAYEPVAEAMMRREMMKLQSSNK